MSDDMPEDKGLACQHVQACLHAGLPSIPPFEVVCGCWYSEITKPMLLTIERPCRLALKLQWQLQAIAHLGMDTFDETIKCL